MNTTTSAPIRFFDGGMGSQLQAKGLTAAELPEDWNLSHPDAVRSIHRDYINAGADIILANTFGANRFKHPGRTAELVTAGIRLAKEAAEESGRPVQVALDLGPTGKLLAPLGTLDFEEAVSVFAEMTEAGVKAGADLILIETMSDTYELKAAVLAAKEHSSLPVYATAIFGESGNLLTGADPEGVAALLEGLGVDGLGLNCGLGPKQMKPIFARLCAATSLPCIITPNAGLPRIENGETIYDVHPDDFAADMAELIAMGASFAGGCCGTTPAHIAAMTAACGKFPCPEANSAPPVYVTSFSRTVELGGAPVCLGTVMDAEENPEIAEALEDEDFDTLVDEASDQADEGAQLLLLNVGAGTDGAVFAQAVSELQGIVNVPLLLTAHSADGLEPALRRYNGKAMVTAKSPCTAADLLPLIRHYGGVLLAEPGCDLAALREQARAAGVDPRQVIARTEGLFAPL